jgi:ankyrin repeat protein
MKSQLIAIVAAVLVVGCGQSDHQHSHDDGHSHAEGDHDHVERDGHDHDKELKAAEPVVEASQPEPPTAKAPDISIHEAVGTGNIEAVKKHLAAGTDVNANDGGWTPLWYAADEGHKEIVELLIAKGADVNVKNKGDVTPLYGAARSGRKEVAELLIAKGADVNARDDVGRIPLHIATGGDHKEIVELLIAKGADVNAKNDKFVGTFLHWAAFSGHKEIAELLIAKGADVNAKDRVGKTPLDRAIEYNQPETANLLRKHGGKTKKELEAAGN